MQTVLGELLLKTQALNFGAIWLKVFRDTALQKRVLDWIRQDQLFNEGVDENNKIIGLYSIATQNINPSKKAGTPFTLYDTGEFYRSMFIAVGVNEIIINADPIKTGDDGKKTDLFKEYGTGIIGLTEENKEKLALEVMARFNQELQRIF